MAQDEFSELNLENDEEFLDTLNGTINSFKDILQKYVGHVSESCTNILASDLDEKLQVVLKEGKRIHGFLFSSFKCPAPVEDDNSRTPLQIECEMLRAQIQVQADELRKAQEEIECLKNQIVNQGTFYASLGAVLGNLAWSSSKISDVVDVWLTRFQEKVSSFLSITCGSFVAFINTYDTEFPPSSNIAYQFIMGLLGIVTNISASPEGRQYLIVHPNGVALVRSIIEFMPKIALSSGSLPLQRLIVVILYNVSMNKSGLQCLLETRIGNALSHCLKVEAMPAELLTLYLRVLQSVTYDLTDPQYVRDISTSVPLKMLEDIAHSGQDELSQVANDVIKQLQVTRKDG